MVVRQVFPGIPVRAVVFTHGAPCTFAEVGPPALPVLLACARFDQSNFFFCHEGLRISKSGLANKQTHPKLANRRAEGRVRYRSPGRRCLDRPVETGMANRGQDQGASRFWTAWCGRCYSLLLLLLFDF